MVYCCKAIGGHRLVPFENISCHCWSLYVVVKNIQEVLTCPDKVIFLPILKLFMQTRSHFSQWISHINKLIRIIAVEARLITLPLAQQIKFHVNPVERARWWVPYGLSKCRTPTGYTPALCALFLRVRILNFNQLSSNINFNRSFFR